MSFETSETGKQYRQGPLPGKVTEMLKKKVYKFIGYTAKPKKIQFISSQFSLWVKFAIYDLRYMTQMSM